jgi:hypothetical protein
MADITERTDEDKLNQFNIQMRSQPWFVEWHRQRGLSPSGYQNRKLKGHEQDELERLVAQHYFNGRVPDGMTIDSGGSLNQKGGWAGLPTWAKAVIIAGAAAATAGAAGVFGGGAGAASAAGGGGGAAASGSAAAIPTIGSTIYGTGMGVAPSLAGASTLAGTAAGAIPTIASTVYGTGMGTAPSIAGTSALSSSGTPFLSTLRRGAGIADAIGRVARGAADQRAYDRAAQADYDLTKAQYDANNTQTHNTQALQYANARTGAERTRFRELMGNDALASLRPPSDPRAVRYGNGPRISPETLQMARARTLKALEDDSDVPQLREVGPMPNMPQGTKADSFLNALNWGGNAFRTLRDFGVF